MIHIKEFWDPQFLEVERSPEIPHVENCQFRLHLRGVKNAFCSGRPQLPLVFGQKSLPCSPGPFQPHLCLGQAGGGCVWYVQ